MAVKFVVSSNQILKVTSAGGCQNAKGGRKRVIEPWEQMQQQPYGDSEEHLSIDIRTPVYQDDNKHIRIGAVGKYNKKNYMARKKTRKAVIQELVINNFAPNNSAMITMTFGADKPLMITETVETDDITPELELIQISNELFGEAVDTVDTVKIYTPSSETDYTRLKNCNREFKKFIQRMIYRFPLFKYVGVVSLQENGNWHYHLICNLNYIDFGELHSLWGNGRVYFSSFKTTGIQGMWKSLKYMQKNLEHAQSKLQGEKGYLASKGLQRNKQYRSWIPEEKEMVTGLKQSLKGVEPNQSYKTLHEYNVTEVNGLYADDKELTASYVYQRYFMDNSDQFPKLPNAYIKKKK